MENLYYTYAYLREDGTPYYIGKGKGNRAYYKNRRVKSPKDKKRILILKKGLSEAEAFRHEVYMIAILGRKDLGTGILRNLTDGGEGTSGSVISEETKRKLSEVARRRVVSEETKRKISEAAKGRVCSKETRRKIGEANRNRVVSEETKRRIGEATRNMSEGARRKISEANRKRVVSEETKKKLKEAKTGENNPNFEKVFSEETRKKMSEARKGTKWWCHPTGKSVRQREKPGPDWVRGMKWKG